MINKKALFLSLLLCGALAVFFSLPLPKGASEMTIFINRMIFPLAFIVPVGYYFVLAGCDEKIENHRGMMIFCVAFISSVVILGYKLYLSLEAPGAWAFHNITVLVQLFFLTLFVFLPFLQGLVFAGVVIFQKENSTKTVSEERCSTESFYNSEYNSAGKMPN
ncbi:MAG: hypothetical protein PHX25_01080 [Candidatus Pacebacteria bacterium]|nr:hypothetical protein [Candidatus Paceibacterota bacterium]